MTLVLHEHPFASYCWKALIALYERDVPFERVFVGDRTDHLELWPLGSIPVLVDGELRAARSRPRSSSTSTASATAPPMIPADPDAALQVRFWDRLIDGHVMTPMQKIVLDALRPAGREDPEGVAAGPRAASRRPTRCSTRA